MTHLYKLMIVMVVVMTTSMAACNTVEGMGEDTQAAGEAVSDTAHDAHN